MTMLSSCSTNRYRFGCGLRLRDPRSSPPILRTELATAAWVRAILLGKTSEARALAGVPQTQTQFAAVYLMLKTPGMSPWLRSGFGRDGKIVELSEYRDNWWSKLNEDVRPVEKFLTDADRAQGASEWKALTGLNNGADYMACGSDVRYLKANPNDPRGAEALALAGARDAPQHYG